VQLWWFARLLHGGQSTVVGVISRLHYRFFFQFDQALRVTQSIGVEPIALHTTCLQVVLLDEITIPIKLFVMIVNGGFVRARFKLAGIASEGLVPTRMSAKKAHTKQLDAVSYVIDAMQLY